MQRLLAILFLVVGLIGILSSQTYVTPGEGTLAQAISEAQDGDVLLLASGTEYTETASSKLGTLVNKNLTLASDSEEKAVIRMLKDDLTSDSAGVFFRMGDQSSLSLNNLEFDGNSKIKYFVSYYMPMAETMTQVNKIHIENCYIHDVTGDVMHGEKSTGLAGYMVFDSTIINNSVFHRTGPVVHYKQAGSDFISITNSTIADVNSYGFRACGYDAQEGSSLPDHTPEVVIDHTTWYNIGTTNAREIILGEKGPILRPWTITNSIFAKQCATGNTKVFINIKDNTTSSNSNMGTIKNICFWEIDKIAFYKHTVQDTIRMDMQFTDPENYDFTLSNNSIAYHIAGDGSKAIGDPRWASSTDIAAPPFKILSISIDGNGSVEVTPKPVIIQFYQPDAVVNLLAKPDSAYQFDSWLGDLTGVDPSATVTMDADKEITAKFVVQTGIVSDKTPAYYELSQNYPNPFNASTMIRFNLKRAGLTTLAIYNLLGKEVLRVIDESLKAGDHQVELTNFDLATGIYFYKLTSGDFVAIKKMALVK
ncbi:MAG: T9SS type A sorting domain-containing protein [Candidatus Marinimicrobia bacterium]|jgi:hypothetical protein|nr:T9SS type A sorting domain-containing protein [Candidatus Neomarinimicrobiota bacterium]